MVSRDDFTHLRDELPLSKKKKIKITEMCIPLNGEIVPADHADPGEIVVVMKVSVIASISFSVPKLSFALP